jgi:hypothetical protein
MNKIPLFTCAIGMIIVGALFESCRWPYIAGGLVLIAIGASVRKC